VIKKILFVFLTLLLFACGSKLDGTYSNNMTGVAEQKMSFTFKPDGTASMSIGSSAIPLEMPYEVNGNKIKMEGQNGDIIFTVLDDGDLLMNGLRLKKEIASELTSAPVEIKVQEAKIPQEKDMTFCRELAAKARAAKPGDFAGDAEFLPAVSGCYKLAKEVGEVLIWSSDNSISSPKDSNNQNSYSASFNCAKASTWAEKAICSDPQLSNLDGLLMDSYNKALSGESHGDALKTTQREWLKSVRNECKDAACLKQTYTSRIAELKKIVETDPKSFSISGEYERYYQGKPNKNSSSITVREMADGKVDVKGNATWIGNAETGNINMGELDGSFLLDGNKIYYTDGENEGCKLTIVFSQNALSVSDDNLRCGGLNVTFDGQYSKVVKAN